MTDNHYHFVFMILIRLHFLIKASVAMRANVCACMVLGGQTGDETGEGGKVLAEGTAVHAKAISAIKKPATGAGFQGAGGGYQGAR
ncbi:hypothetical protein [Aeromonas hydrophila]|uniref:hypothetical protein n=1 Tax=Aeromonas hydrophila TaxID=644 RepID=UPI000A6DD4E8|nr:hypothetical protein [Aeromonas hydrophila]EJN6954529.1 hypothetical protein [Aeromonas hydrophila]MCX4040752.1 hypothetical protein [Aeromonas hydrophila]HAU4874867.1 hypothetical protein [Aeromonas hydrophila]HAU4920079.1 hypothetical protein [Aeromonas hydrophila]